MRPHSADRSGGVSVAAVVSAGAGIPVLVWAWTMWRANETGLLSLGLVVCNSILILLALANLWVLPVSSYVEFETRAIGELSIRGSWKALWRKSRSAARRAKHVTALLALLLLGAVDFGWVYLIIRLDPERLPLRVFSFTCGFWTLLMATIFPVVWLLKTLGSSAKEK